MIFLFIVNVIVLTLVAREFCQKVTEETPNEAREEEERKTSELPAVELTIEEELVTKKSGQEETQEKPNQTTGAEERTEVVTVKTTTGKEGTQENPTDGSSWFDKITVDKTELTKHRVDKNRVDKTQS